MMGFHENLVALNCMIDGLCKAGHIDRAMELYKSMETKDSVTYTSLVHNLCRAGRFRCASKLMMKCLKDGKKILRATKRAVLAGLRSSGYTDEAKKLQWKIQHHAKAPALVIFLNISCLGLVTCSTKHRIVIVKSNGESELEWFCRCLRGKDYSNKQIVAMFMNDWPSPETFLKCNWLALLGAVWIELRITTPGRHLMVTQERNTIAMIPEQGKNDG
ncbi:unnamed protein product [Prunus armeniaca]|uniref:DYW domain-containing protein n=1 Tax=Prunus armeniaca TaxID=36596 RepID=A0A6J5U9P5_PRUAR|nr:unnamed protein product [Prunus armeniaca]